MISLYLKLTFKMMSLKTLDYMILLFVKEIFTGSSPVSKIISSADGFKFPIMLSDTLEISINQWALASQLFHFLKELLKMFLK